MSEAGHEFVRPGAGESVFGPEGPREWGNTASAVG